MTFFRTLLTFCATSLVLHAAETNLKIISPTVVHALKPVTLEANTKEGGFSWIVQNIDPDTMLNARQPKAQFTPPRAGTFRVVLVHSVGKEEQVVYHTLTALNNPEQDDSPFFIDAKKVPYKHPLDVLGGKTSLYLHVFGASQPAVTPRPCVILFHGGSGPTAGPENNVEECRYWASRGMVAISAQYRFGRRDGTDIRESVMDAKSAVRYVRAHAAELGVDPKKIVVGGISSGAHLAACTATVAGCHDSSDDLAVSCVPNALLLYYPLGLISDRGTREDRVELSPLSFVGAATPATLIITGAEDRVAPPERAIEWGKKMKAPFRLLIYRDTAHVSERRFFTRPGVDNDTLRQSDRFLVAVGMLTGADTVSPVMSPDEISGLYMMPADYMKDLMARRAKYGK